MALSIIWGFAESSDPPSLSADTAEMTDVLHFPDKDLSRTTRVMTFGPLKQRRKLHHIVITPENLLEECQGGWKACLLPVSNQQSTPVSLP